MKKKGIAIVLLLAGLAVGVTGCSTKKVDLEAKGLELIQLMDEKAESDAYVQMFSTTPDMYDLIAIYAEGEYAKPKAVYQLSFSPKEYFEKIEAKINAEDLSEELQEELEQKLYGGFSNLLNGQEGALTLATTATLNTTTAFAGKGMETAVIYFYFFGTEGTPAVVTFLPMEENVIAASASFVGLEEFREVSSKTEAKELLETLTAMLGVTEVTEVK